MLAVDTLSKTYPASGAIGNTVRGQLSPKDVFGGIRKIVLDSVCFSSEGGKVFCVLGPNGSGKTTLLKILAGLVLPDAGRIEITIRNRKLAPLDAKPWTGFSPAEAKSFYGRLSCEENLRFFAGIRGIGEEEFQKRLQEMAAPLNLRGFLASPFQRVSAGMRQRLALARALIHGPSLLILDEPTQFLDSQSAERFFAFIRQDALGHPERLVVWATHRVEEAWRVAAEILVLSQGKILTQATPAELLRRTGASSALEAYRHIAGNPQP